MLPQRVEAAAGLRRLPGEHMGRAQRPMHPARGRMLGQRPLLPACTFGVLTGGEKRAADPDHAVERQRIVRREVERDLEPLDGGSRIALVDVDPSAAAPGPGRSAVDRQRLAGDEIGGVERVEQRQRIAQDGQHRGVVAQRPRLVHEFEASRALLRGRGREMIDDALDMRPGGQRGRERMVRVRSAARDRAVPARGHCRWRRGRERRAWRAAPDRRRRGRPPACAARGRSRPAADMAAAPRRSGPRDVRRLRFRRAGRHRRDAPRAGGRFRCRSA